MVTEKCMPYTRTFFLVSAIFDVVFVSARIVTPLILSEEQSRTNYVYPTFITHRKDQLGPYQSPARSLLLLFV
jgi:hypothetical protein